MIDSRAGRRAGSSFARRLASLSAMLVVIGGLAGPFAQPAAHAERADRDKPTNIEADRASYDDAKKVTVFSGNVVMTKGTILLRGDRVVLRQFEAGGQTAVATGKRASFRQKRDGVDQYVVGLGNEIEYDSRNETLKVIGDALVRRTECEAVVDEITGALVVYNGRTEVFTVDGKEAGSGSGRVRIVIQPRSDGKPGDAKPGDGKASDGKGADGKGADGKGADARTSDGKPACPPGAPVPLRPAASLASPPSR